MKKRALSIVIVIVLAIAGLSLLLYPMVANIWNNYRQTQLLSTYTEAVEASDDIDYEAELAKAQAYNAALQPMILPDSFAVAEATEEADATYMDCLNLTHDEYGTMGSIEIPKINIELPIFHTTEKEVLENGAGHLEGSSLPVGGEGTHAVISAHRGLPSASLFTDLDQLEIGDHFLIHVLDQTLCYEVDQILVVDPEDTSALAAVDGEDYVTLLTCTPYGVNTQRLLVRGHRVPYDEETVAADGTAPLSTHTNYAMWVVIGLAIVAAFIFLLYMRDKRLRNKQKVVESEPKIDEPSDD